MRRFRRLGFEALEDRSLLSGFVSIQSVAASEGTAANTTMRFPVTYDGMPVPGGFSVGFQTADTTAIGFTGSQSNSDYYEESGSLSFSGTPGETKFIDVLISGDSLVEMTEYFQVNLTSVSKPGIGLSGGAGGTIGNDDSAVVNMTLSDGSPDPSLVEDDDPQTLESWLYLIRLSANVDMPIDVYYQIIPMGIEEFVDIDTITPWTERHIVLSNTLPAYQGTVITPDTLVEPDESFQWRLTRIEAQGRQVTIGSHAPVCTIENNDKLKIVVDNLRQAEGTAVADTDFVVNIHAINKVEGGATVTFMTNAYTAGDMEGDYVFKQDSFTFTETGPQAFTMTVKVKADSAREANEKFCVYASNPQGNFPIVLQNDKDYGWGLITIDNDDEGTYTNTGGGRIAFYNSAVVNGAACKWFAENNYPVSFDVVSPAAMLTQLTAWVAAHGRVDEIGIFDHGTELGQEIGGIRITGPDTQAFAPLSNDGLHIWFFGCKVGKTEPDSGNAYSDWVCDDAAPAATVKASKIDHLVFPGPNGTWTTDAVWVNFNGFDKP